MQGSGWLAVLGRIPPQKHNCLLIVTNTGAEIVLREIVRVESEFMILRGRMAGSTDEGRVLILPFDQVTYFAFNKMLPEAEIQAMFGKSTATVQWATTAEPSAAAAGLQTAAAGETTDSGLPPATAPADPAIPAVAAQGAEGAAAAPLPGGGKAVPKPTHPSKSLLLARLRARLANEDGGPFTR